MSKTEKIDGFIKLEREFVRSGQFRQLSPNARCVLIDIWSWYNGFNNGAIRYAIAQAQDCLGCSRSTAIRALNELKQAGLIEEVERGGFRYRAGEREGRATAWRITTL